MSTIDTLDSLSDAELSEVFAVEVAGYHVTVNRANPQPFATSADAVLPWLEKQSFRYQFYCTARPELRHCFQIADSESKYVQTDASTFARGACIALLRAKRAAK